ncbi:MAG: spore maturation protein [Acidobacteria bacterium]|nr:spore maturation protein [Acidobacteriota bacterium]
MLNGLFVFVIVASILLAALTGRMEQLSQAVLSSAGEAVTLAIGLVGVMAFFLGLMRVAEDAGLLRRVARAIGPVMRLLFPDVPSDHPAMSAMILNISSNMLGLANAATPFGIRAMEELDKLNSRKGTASNAMVLFLAINTAGLAVLPSGVIGLRASLGSADAAGILLPTWFASGCATIVGVLVATLLSRLPYYRVSEPPGLPAKQVLEDKVSLSQEVANLEDTEFEGTRSKEISKRRWVVLAFWITFIGLFIRHILTTPTDASADDLARSIMSNWSLPVIIASLILYGWAHGVRVYDSLIIGAKQGFEVALRIIPYLVAILVAIAMFRASGGIDLMGIMVAPITTLIQMPPEALPMAILRPLSGSGAYGNMAEIMSTHGPDSLIGYMVSTFQGSTETTFYTLAVYFGAIGIVRARHAIISCLMADVAGILAAVFIVNLLFG